MHAGTITAYWLSDFDAVMAVGYSLSLMTSWSNSTVTRLWINTPLANGAEVPE